MEQAETIPLRELDEPLGDVMTEFSIQRDPVVKLGGLLVYVSHVGEEGHAWPAYLVHKVEFAHQGKMVCLVMALVWATPQSFVVMS